MICIENEFFNESLELKKNFSEKLSEIFLVQEEQIEEFELFLSEKSSITVNIFLVIYLHF